MPPAPYPPLPPGEDGQSLAVFERWARDLRRTGGFGSGSPHVREGWAGSVDAGCLIEFQLEIRDGMIQQARYRYRGGPWTGAACAYYAEWLEGRAARPDEVPAGRVVAERLAYPRIRYDEALLVEDAILDALGNETRSGCGDPFGSRTG